MEYGSLQLNGYQHLPAVVGRFELETISKHLELTPVDSAGSRNLLASGWCRDVAVLLRGELVERGLLSDREVAVQCTLFRKMRSRNWKVSWHQDTFVPVARRVGHPGLSAWSEKEGTHFVKVPADLLQSMLAVRLHLDPCGKDDGPLSIVPGSHCRGPMDPEQARSVRESHGTDICLAEEGDLLIMRPLLLHSSSSARYPQGMRRVLHFLFGPTDPGYGLDWSIAA